MIEGKFLAIDFGSESGRAIVGILSDNKIELEEVHRFPNKQGKIFNSLHWDILYLFDELKRGIAKAVKRGHDDIESIGVDTWGVDFGLIAKDGQLLGNPFAYRDSRTDGMLERAFELIPKKDLYNFTGIQLMQINSAFQLLSMIISNSSLLESADKLLFMPDLFNYLLTGEKKSEYSIASTSQLLNAKDETWDQSVFNALKIPINIMAPIIAPGTNIGKLLDSIAEPLGIKNIDVIAPGCHDTACAVAAVPAHGDNWAYLSSGSWSLVGIESDVPIINERALEYNFTNEGGVGGKIRFLKNMMGMWLVQQLKNEWKENGLEYSYAELSKQAEEAPEFKCIIDPDDNAFLHPKKMSLAIDEFCKKTNQAKPENVGEYIRSVLESLAFKYRETIDKINLFRKTQIEVLHIVGGGSQNELLNQFAANATGLKVIAGPVEATALGNIMMQAIAKGKIISIEKGRKIIANSSSLKEYDPVQESNWNEVYKKITWKDKT